MKKKKSKIKQKTKFSFTQKWGTYRNETFVVVGMTHNQIIALMKRQKFHKEWITEFDKNKADNDSKWFAGGNSGVTWLHEGKSILWFKTWKNDWFHWDCLVHEVSHLIDGILVETRSMGNETEAKAYQFEYMFRNLRRKFYEICP